MAGHAELRGESGGSFEVLHSRLQPRLGPGKVLSPLPVCLKGAVTSGYLAGALLAGRAQRGSGHRSLCVTASGEERGRERNVEPQLG